MRKRKGGSMFTFRAKRRMTRLSLFLGLQVSPIVIAHGTGYHPLDPFEQMTHGSSPIKDNGVANNNQEPKKPSSKGRWLAKSFRVSCGTDQGLSKETYVSAAVGSQKQSGDDCFGSYLHVSNKSSKYPAYFGLDGKLTEKLDPKQSKIIRLPVDQPEDRIKIAVTVNFYVKFWDEVGS